MVGLLYTCLSRNDIKGFVDCLMEYIEDKRTERLRLVETKILDRIGRELGRLLVDENWRYSRLLSLWRFSLRDLKKLAYGLHGGREIRYVVISALGFLSKEDYAGVRIFLDKVLNELPDWETVDAFALRVVVNLIRQNRDEMFKLLREWGCSENRWIRRLAVASIPPYVRTSPNDIEECLSVIALMMSEKDVMVRKAVGWALREISKKNIDAVYRFLLGYKGSNDKYTRWIIREGSKKLPPDLRARLYSNNFYRT